MTPVMAKILISLMQLVSSGKFSRGTTIFLITLTRKRGYRNVVLDFQDGCRVHASEE